MTPDATRAHIDAETMAAWADHGLSAEDAAAVELHLSNCDRCQEVLAAFVRSEPPAGAVIIPFWARRPVRWSAAGLAAAAAIVTMVLIGRPPAAPTSETTVAMRDAAPAAPSTAPQAVDQLAPKREAAEAASTSAAAGRRVDDKKLEQRSDTPTSQAKAAQEPLRKESQRRTETIVGGGTLAAPPPAAATMPPPPPPPPVTVAAAQAPPPSQSPQPTPSPQGAVGGIAGGSVAAPSITASRPAAMAESVSAITIPPPIEIPAPDESLARRSGLGAGRGGGGGRAAASDAAANAGQVRWRILAGTRVERTQDGGASWSAATIEPELKTRLVGGTATSQTNCWIIGREGVVLVTTDGRTFRRVSLPEAVQLASIIAQDHLRATVTAIDGRTFTTTDGGLTWK